MKKTRMLGVGILLGFAPALHAEQAPLILNVAVQESPQIRALQDGQIKADGCDIHLSTYTLAQLQADLTQSHHFDVLEVDIVPYLEMKSAGALTEYMLIPVFLSRQFQARNIVVRKDRGIHRPEDLRGKTVGVSSYRGTTPTWLRGILQSSWSVKPADIAWIDTDSATSPVKSLSAGLASGRLDAAFSPDLASQLSDRDPNLARLFPDYYKSEFATFENTRIFPIVTAVAVRKAIVDENPWVAESLFMAFSRAKKKAVANMTLPLPWGGSELAETEKLMGKNFWSYGVKSNPKTLGALFQYMREQNLLKSEMSADDVFAPSTLLLMED